MAFMSAVAQGTQDLQYIYEAVKYAVIKNSIKKANDIPHTDKVAIFACALITTAIGAGMGYGLDHSSGGLLAGAAGGFVVGIVGYYIGKIIYHVCEYYAKSLDPEKMQKYADEIINMFTTERNQNSAQSGSILSTDPETAAIVKQRNVKLNQTIDFLEALPSRSRRVADIL